MGRCEGDGVGRVGEDEGLFGEMEERETVIDFLKAHVSADDG